VPFDKQAYNEKIKHEMPQYGNYSLIIHDGLKAIQYFPGFWHGGMVLGYGFVTLKVVKK
jgi:hypothetical protein